MTLNNQKLYSLLWRLNRLSNILRIIQSTKPDEIYNLGAQSHVHTSFEIPEYSANADALGTLRILEAIRVLKLQKKTKFYQASTSEIFGNTEIPQNEKTRLDQEALTQFQSFMLIGLQLIIEKPIIFLL